MIAILRLYSLKILDEQMKYNLTTFCLTGYYSFLYTGANQYGNDTSIGDYKAVLDTQEFLNSNPPQPFFIFIPGIGAHPQLLAWEK